MKNRVVFDLFKFVLWFIFEMAVFDINNYMSMLYDWIESAFFKASGKKI